MTKDQDWRGKKIFTVWKKSEDPKPEFEGDQPHPDLKFTCDCGFSSKEGPYHQCPRGTGYAPNK